MGLDSVYYLVQGRVHVLGVASCIWLWKYLDIVCIPEPEPPKGFSECVRIGSAQARSLGHPEGACLHGFRGSAMLVWLRDGQRSL